VGVDVGEGAGEGAGAGAEVDVDVDAGKRVDAGAGVVAAHTRERRRSLQPMSPMSGKSPQPRAPPRQLELASENPTS